MNPIISGALPYGADPDPMATKRHQPPCLGCSEFKTRQIKAKLMTRESYLLPQRCRLCKARMDYADATDPSRQRYTPRGAQANVLKAGMTSGYHERQGDGLYVSLDTRAAAFGWPDGFFHAVEDLRTKEGCSWRVIGQLFGISASSASRAFRRHQAKVGG